jgi:hypothetical protein
MLRWAKQIASTGEKRNAYKIIIEKPEGTKYLQADGRIILKLG